MAKWRRARASLTEEGIKFLHQIHRSCCISGIGTYPFPQFFNLCGILSSVIGTTLCGLIVCCASSWEEEEEEAPQVPTPTTHISPSPFPAILFFCALICTLHSQEFCTFLFFICMFSGVPGYCTLLSFSLLLLLGGYCISSWIYGLWVGEKESLLG